MPERAHAGRESMTVDWMRPWLFKHANSTMPSRLPRSVHAPLSLSSLSVLSLHSVCSLLSRVRRLRGARARPRALSACSSPQYRECTLHILILRRPHAAHNTQPTTRTKAVTTGKARADTAPCAVERFRRGGRLLPVSVFALAYPRSRVRRMSATEEPAG